MASASDLPSHFRDWDASNRSSAKMEKKTGGAKSFNLFSRENRAKHSWKPIWKRPWVIAISAIVFAVILLAVIIPLATTLTKPKKHNASILLPLYIYPDTDTTWNPLYDALAAQPDLQYIVIVNPSSGPGSSQYPDKQYSAQLERLAKYPNVRTVGYVRTGYASRNLTDVLSEVSTFAGWSSKNSVYAMHGIFFDESPHQFSEAAVDFMNQATRHVKAANGLVGERTVIRNPGVIPAPQFQDIHTDISVVFEESYQTYGMKESSLAELPKSRSEYCYMVHSVPVMGKGKLKAFVDGLSKRAEYLFVTSNAEHYYETFGGDWAEFTSVVPK